MKGFKIFISVLACIIILAGCEKATEESAQPSTDVVLESETSAPLPMEGDSELAQTAYAAFLLGDISLFNSDDVYTWALDTWKDTILFYGELEYTYLDLDGDGVEELLIQWADDPCSYNGVFHYESGKLYCWQHDDMEGSCRDYPLQDGTMVRQYDYNGTRSYTVFCYQANGEMEELFSLFAREELIPEDSANPCPYYEVDGNEVDKTVFDEQLNDLITNQMLNRSAWKAI